MGACFEQVDELESNVFSMSVFDFKQGYVCYVAARKSG